MAGLAPLLVSFLVLRLAQLAAELWLSRLNRRHSLDPARQAEARLLLRMSADDMARALAYAGDRYRLGLVARAGGVLAMLALVVAGGLGWVEELAGRTSAAAGRGPVVEGLVFFALLGLAGTLARLPVSIYNTFVIEERHGFNRQTWRGFASDQVKTVALSVLLGGPLLAGVLALMTGAGPRWWLYAWLVVAAFNVLVVWLYPTVLAPLFNRFSPLPEGPLREGLQALAARAGVRLGGISVMDASRRSSHGNAYFTGLFRSRSFVIFDTLLEALDTREAIAVLAHEMGHDRLGHVPRELARGVALAGAQIYVLSLCAGWPVFHTAFGLQGPSAHGTLAVFGLWSAVAGFLLQPLQNALSRRNERAADAFSVRHTGTPRDFASALLKLRANRQALPLAHPLYCAVYLSHPPLLDRLRALRWTPDGEDGAAGGGNAASAGAAGRSAAPPSAGGGLAAAAAGV